MTEPNAKVICDSISPSGNRLTTLEITLHRFVLAEFNTHRVFSRNSASSRAIPAHKMLERVKRDCAYPVEWPAEQSGMQGGKLLGGEALRRARVAWGDARDAAVRAARELQTIGVHKSVTNRLLEPFLWHTIIVTSTKWDNFWELRCSPMAQPEIRIAAEAMRAAYSASTPKPVYLGEWHLPYHNPDLDGDLSPEDLKKVCAARCARVSYLTHDEKRDPAKDLELFDRLWNAGHYSPFEHVATPADWSRGYTPLGNFHGWEQLRHNI